MDALHIARTGLVAATHRLGAAAQRAATGKGDTARETVTMIEAKHAFKASALVVKMSDEMWRVLLDVQDRDLEDPRETREL
ncbi:flagellar basal body rod C-terminal domain-containing protein [Phenylobacterium sp.]|jgi:hypothetical protein|uniref:flagellar basal body rod C-terminal domain-containing protein n=1 Tax=Phenylobacterium sp. TaxID=1871053 RepID=UPI0037838ED6